MVKAGNPFYLCESFSYIKIEVNEIHFFSAVRANTYVRSFSEILLKAI